MFEINIEGFNTIEDPKDIYSLLICFMNIGFKKERKKECVCVCERER